jgi:hypothetical protein
MIRAKIVLVAVVVCIVILRFFVPMVDWDSMNSRRIAEGTSSYEVVFCFVQSNSALWAVCLLFLLR